MSLFAPQPTEGAFLLDVAYGSAWTVTSPYGRKRAHTFVCVDSVLDRAAVEETLAGRRLAAVLTDPPYSSGGLHAMNRRQSTSAKYQHDVGKAKRRYLDWSGDARDQRSWAAWCALWLSHLVRLSEPDTYLFSFTDWRQLPTLTDAIQMAGWTWRGVAVWDKGDGVRAPHQGYFRHQAEYVVWGTAGRLGASFDRGRVIPGVFTCPPERNKVHLAQKPIETLSWILSLTDHTEGIIVDPFAGAGSTLIASDGLGRESISFELSPEITALALARFTSLGYVVRPSIDHASPDEKPFSESKNQTPDVSLTAARETSPRREIPKNFPRDA